MEKISEKKRMGDWSRLVQRIGLSPSRHYRSVGLLWQQPSNYSGMHHVRLIHFLVHLSWEPEPSFYFLFEESLKRILWKNSKVFYVSFVKDLTFRPQKGECKSSKFFYSIQIFEPVTSVKSIFSFKFNKLSLYLSLQKWK